LKHTLILLILNTPNTCENNFFYLPTSDLRCQKKCSLALQNNVQIKHITFGGVLHIKLRFWIFVLRWREMVLQSTWVGSVHFTWPSSYSTNIHLNFFFKFFFCDECKNLWLVSLRYRYSRHKKNDLDSWYDIFSFFRRYFVRLFNKSRYWIVGVINIPSMGVCLTFSILYLSKLTILGFYWKQM